MVAKIYFFEIVDEGVAATNALRRKANRAVERQMKADFAKLDRERQMRFSAQVSIMGAVAMMTRAPSIEKVAKAAPTGARELPIAETLKMFAR